MTRQNSNKNTRRQHNNRLSHYDSRTLVLYSLVFAILASLTFAKVGYAGPLDDLQPGHWYMAPSSKLTDAGVTTSAISTTHYNSIQGTMGVLGITDAWGGGAYDTKRERMIVWGGGHGDYAGNEVYAFDINNLTWSHLTLPSQGPFSGAETLADNTPAARHTYDGLEYIPEPYDRFFGGGAFTYPHAGGTTIPWVLNFSNNTWTALDKFPGSGMRFSAYDTVTGRLYVHGTYNLWTIDLQGNSKVSFWEKMTSHAWFPEGGTMAIDPIRQKLVHIGNNNAYLWDLTSPAAPRVDMSLSGPNTITTANGPGLDYDPVTDKIVAWSGGADIFLLDLDAMSWTKQSPATGNSVVPPAAVTAGTFGRFRYIPSKNVFILINHANQNVYFYKASANKAVITPPQPAKPVVN